MLLRKCYKGIREGDTGKKRRERQRQKKREDFISKYFEFVSGYVYFKKALNFLNQSDFVNIKNLRVP
jgi:hypothetical protein